MIFESFKRNDVGGLLKVDNCEVPILDIVEAKRGMWTNCGLVEIKAAKNGDYIFVKHTNEKTN